MTPRREPGRLAIVPADPRRRVKVAAPGPVELEHRLAENAALSAWGRPGTGNYGDQLGCEGWPGALPDAGLTDDERASLGLPTTGHGTRPGPAQGHPLRESREAVRRRRQWLCAALALFVVALAFGFAP